MAASRRHVAFMACPPEDFAGFIQYLRHREPDGDWALITFYPLPAPVPASFEVTVVARAIAASVKLVARSLLRPYASAVVCCHDLHQQDALQMLLAFVGLLRARERKIVDRNGRERPIHEGAGDALGIAAAVVLLLPLNILITRVGVRLWTSDRPTAEPSPSSGRIALLVPIVPDLSHTFVYREVLALKTQHPDWLVLLLERGDPAIVHLEAAEVMRVGTFVPHLSAAQYLWEYCRAWCRRPSAMAALVRFLRPHTASFEAGAIANDDLVFLRLQYLHHSSHVMLGFVLAQFLRSRGVSYVHVYGSTFQSLRAMVAHRLYGIPYSVSTYVDFEAVTPFHMLREKFARARFVTTCCAYCSTRLATLLPDTPLDVRVAHAALPSCYVEGKRLRADDGVSRLVYVGRFVEKKGLDTLVRACALLRDRDVAFTCYLHGAGPEQERLEQLVTEYGLRDVVQFEGPLPNERFYDAMNRKDVFVCPSRYVADGERDGIPVTLMEAMAAGVTVVSTRVSGIPELVHDGVNGYLTAPDDPAALADLLGRVLTDSHARTAVTDAAVRTIHERFNLEQWSTTIAGWIATEAAPPANPTAR